MLGDIVGAYVGPYFSCPLICFPLTQCLSPNGHMFDVSVALTVAAKTDLRMSALGGRETIG